MFNGYKVSTITIQPFIDNSIKLGIDTSKYFSYIFETMVFKSVDDYTDLDCRRVNTLEEALANHEELCRYFELIVFN